MPRILQWQMTVPRDAREALARAEKGCVEAKRLGADLLALPEMFCCPYETAQFPLRAEPEGGETYQRCAELARRYRVWLSAGSVPECGADGKVYNTAYSLTATAIASQSIARCTFLTSTWRGDSAFASRTRSAPATR